LSKKKDPVARALVRDLSLSKVREIANAGFGKQDLLRFWFGESNLSTPQYVRQAAADALTAGRTFYTHNNGNAELRAALADYLTRLHRRPFNAAEITVTSSGVSALMIAMQTIVDPGDRVVVVTPVWPNVAEIPRILGADVIRFRRINSFESSVSGNSRALYSCLRIKLAGSMPKYVSKLEIVSSSGGVCRYSMISGSIPWSCNSASA
jgi:aspartate/methionine/tyrosine aminotransferase